MVRQSFWGIGGSPGPPLTWAGGNWRGLLSARSIWRFRSRRKQRGITTTRLQEKSSRTRGNSESSDGGTRTREGSTGPSQSGGTPPLILSRTLGQRRELVPPHIEVPQRPQLPQPRRQRPQPVTADVLWGKAAVRGVLTQPDPRGARSPCPGAHQLPQRAQGAEVRGQLGQAVVAGVEDAQGQEAEAGGQRAQLVPAAGGTAGSRGAAGPPKSPSRGWAVPKVQVRQGLEVGDGRGDAAQAVVVQAEPLQRDQATSGLGHLPETVPGQVWRDEGDTGGHAGQGRGPIGSGDPQGGRKTDGDKRSSGIRTGDADPRGQGC